MVYRWVYKSTNITLGGTSNLFPGGGLIWLSGLAGLSFGQAVKLDASGTDGAAGKDGNRPGEPLGHGAPTGPPGDSLGISGMVVIHSFSGMVSVGFESSKSLDHLMKFPRKQTIPKCFQKQHG